jgi:hypothetical protein
MDQIGVGGGCRRSGEEETGGIGKGQHHARLVTGGVCVCVCVCVCGLLELIAKDMTIVT